MAAHALPPSPDVLLSFAERRDQELGRLTPSLRAAARSALAQARPIGMPSTVLRKQRALQAIRSHYACLGLRCPHVVFVENDLDAGERLRLALQRGSECDEARLDAIRLRVEASRHYWRYHAIGIARSFLIGEVVVAGALMVADVIRPDAAQVASSVLERWELDDDCRESAAGTLERMDLAALHATETRLTEIASDTPALPAPPAVRAMRAMMDPLLDLHEAGAWAVLFMRDECVVIPQPLRREVRGRFHSTLEPALEWPGGTRLHFVRGFEVDARFVQAPETLTWQDIEHEENAERRSALIDLFGAERISEMRDTRQVSHDDFGILLRRTTRFGDVMQCVLVENSTPEPDGSRKRYVLRVPPHVATARQAVAWTFGLPEREYAPDIET